MKKLTLPLLFFFAFVSTFFAQGFDLPSGVSVSNQMKYSYDQDLKREIFEDWFNADYRYGIFKAGIRFDVFQPNDPNPAISRGKEKYGDIGFKYLSVSLGKRKRGLDLTVGNFYSVFGRGLVVKIFENRNIRIDNNLLGAKFSGRYKAFRLTAFSGMPESADAVRKDILHAADLEFRGIKRTKIGVSFASNRPYLDGIATTNLLSGRVSARFGKFDFYGEYGVKQNADLENEIDRNIVGRGIYGNLNFYFGSFSVSTEYKYYDNFKFTSYDGTVVYNTPPSTTQDYSYILLNRHPHALNQDNEQGGQIAVNYVFDPTFDFKANFGITKTLDDNSFYQIIKGTHLDVRTQLTEAYAQLHKDWKNFMTIFAFGYGKELSANTENFTPVFEGRYYLNDENTLRFVWEHQQVRVISTEEKYYDDVLVFEWMRSPDLVFSFVGEMQTKEPTAGNLEREFWAFGMVTYNIFEGSELSLLIGSRHAGNICVGGVCRYEPEFKGIELKMTNRIF
jgi:hypothetical protein